MQRGDFSSIFIEKETREDVNRLKGFLLNDPNAKDIQAFFFPNLRTHGLHQITSNQIKKHSKILNSKNRSILSSVMANPTSADTIASMNKNIKKIQDEKTK
jgi:hypothetical protein